MMGGGRRNMGGGKRNMGGGRKNTRKCQGVGWN
jgi:hypothetical protein